MKLNAKQLRAIDEPTDEDIGRISRNPISIIVDNVLDTYNVGSIFRLADAVAAEKVYLCGQTLTPPNSRIKKASIQTWKWVPWEHATTAVEAIGTIRKTKPDTKIVAIEQDDRSVPFDDAQYEFPVAIIVGHESDGVSRDALDIADTIVELPMFGVNVSLNVMVSCGIILYHIVAARGLRAELQ